jgi:hypothetical protein
MLNGLWDKAGGACGEVVLLLYLYAGGTLSVLYAYETGAAEGERQYHEGADGEYPRGVAPVSRKVV